MNGPDSPTTGDQQLPWQPSEIWLAMQHAVDLLVLLETDGTVRFANQASIPLNQSLAKSTNAATRGQFTASLNRVVKSGQLERLALSLTDCDLPLGQYDVRLIPLRGDRQVTGVAVIGSDMAERTSRERQWLRDRQLLCNQLDLQDRDRRLVAYELHDGLIQDVVGAQMILESVSGQLQDPNSPLTAAFEMLRRLMRKAIDEGRRLINELRPMIVDEQGIVEALRYLISEEDAMGNAPISFQHQLQSESLPPLLGGTLYRLLQEALSNVRRHSRCEHVDVTLTESDDQLVLRVVDDGIGFDPEHVSTDSRGLRGVRERAMLFGGTAEITSRPGQGTQFQVTLPNDLADLTPGDDVD